MKNSVKAWLVFRRILLLLFLFFLINYFQAESNNNLLTQKTVLTEEQIKEFEEDVKNGEFVDIKDYTSVNNIDTSNSVSNLGYNLGNGISEFFGIRIVDFIDFISSFVT